MTCIFNRFILEMQYTVTVSIEYVAREKMLRSLKFRIYNSIKKECNLVDIMHHTQRNNRTVKLMINQWFTRRHIFIKYVCYRTHFVLKSPEYYYMYYQNLLQSEINKESINQESKFEVIETKLKMLISLISSIQIN